MENIFTSVPLPTIRELLKLYGFRAIKQLSQNFLLDFRLTDKIVRNAGNLRGAEVCEIGPGPGGITRCIIGKNPSKLVVVEKDYRFKPLMDTLQKASPVPIQAFYSDIRKFDMSDLFSEEGKKEWNDVSPRIFLIGNLPFNVSTYLIIKWMKDISLKRNAWKYGRVKMALTFQEEVAQRIVSPVLSKTRCRLSVTCQNWCKTEFKFLIPGSAFIPKPKVNVGVVTFEPLKQPLIDMDFDLIQKIFTVTFNNRQKQIKNTVSNLFPEDLKKLSDELFQMADLDPRLRPFQLTHEDFGKICKAYKHFCDEDPRIYKYNYRGQSALREFEWKIPENTSDTFQDSKTVSLIN